MFFVRRVTLFLTLGLIPTNLAATITHQEDWPFWATILISLGLHVSLIIAVALGYHWNTCAESKEDEEE